MKRYLSYLLIVISTCFALRSNAQQVKVEAKVDRVSVPIGEQTKLHLIAHIPANTRGAPSGRWNSTQRGTDINNARHEGFRVCRAYFESTVQAVRFGILSNRTIRPLPAERSARRGDWPKLAATRLDRVAPWRREQTPSRTMAT